MNRKERLLADTLVSGEQFARLAAALARRRRAIRRVALVGSGIVAALIAAIFVTRQPARPPMMTQIPAAPKIEIMTDTDLRTQLKGQPVMFLKDKDGISSVVFLDENTSSPL